MRAVPQHPRAASTTPGGRTSAYPVPAVVHRAEQTIRKSRFIATVGPAGKAATAAAFVHGVRAEFPDATHHCWAYLLGPPGTTASIGLSDDREPHGTAGRPILAALLHSGVGDVVAVVTRYYGGTNLGTGGLVRAYGGTARLALESLARTLRVFKVPIEVRVPYGAVSAARRALVGFAPPTQRVGPGTQVSFTLDVPDDRLDELRVALADATGGQGQIVARPSADPESGGYDG